MNGYDATDLIEKAKAVCVQKIEEWIVKKSARDDAAKVDASTRYKILKAARGKCELCGISAKISPIDIDHIVPRSKADKDDHVVRDRVRMHLDDERNLQALCFRCNRAKRDQDDTDFRLPSPKLVRDRIPDLIRSSNRTPVTKRLDGAALQAQLLEKLTEEHAEFLMAMDEEEAEQTAEQKLDDLVDVIEVLLALGKTLGHAEPATLDRLHEKRKEKGGFDDGVFLVDVHPPS